MPTTVSKRVVCHGDEGAVMVESAMLLPILIMMMAGIVDMGVGIRDRITIQSALRSAGRANASLGTGSTADQFALTSFWASYNKVNNAVLNRVVVYQTDTNGVVPTTCTTVTLNSTTGAGFNTATVKCNVYSLTQVQNASTTFTYANSGCTSGWDRFWCPAVRRDDLSGTNSPPDYLGMWVNVTYTPFTRAIVPSITLTDRVVYRLEPSVS